MIAIKIISLICSMLITFAISVAILIYGWGLEPQNWWWIIGGYAAMMVSSMLYGKITGCRDNDSSG